MLRLQEYEPQNDKNQIDFIKQCLEKNKEKHIKELKTFPFFDNDLTNMENREKKLYLGFEPYCSNINQKRVTLLRRCASKSNRMITEINNYITTLLDPNANLTTKNRERKQGLEQFGSTIVWCLYLLGSFVESSWKDDDGDTEMFKEMSVVLDQANKALGTYKFKIIAENLMKVLVKYNSDI